MYQTSQQQRHVLGSPGWRSDSILSASDIQKRPKSSFVRFEADLPNERWQPDITHWKLADDTEVEILNVIDDHSRLLIASDTRQVFKVAVGS